MNLKRLSVYLSLGLLTAMLGVYVFEWSSPHFSPAASTESPPCASCAAVYSEASPDVPNVSLCDLESDPGRYDGRIVRVSTLVKHDSGYFGLGDGQSCPREKFIQTIFDPATPACSGTREVFESRLGHKHVCWRHPFGFDGSVRVMIVGRFKSGVNTYDGSTRDSFQFIILCIERIEEMTDSRH
jgi:hypothetical protein